MKNALLFLLFALCASLAHAEPGSFCKATFSFTIKTTRDTADVVNLDGSITEGVKIKTTKVGNLQLLAEAQRQGILTAGSLSGWVIRTMHDADAFIEVVATNGAQMVSLKPVIHITGLGVAEKGTWVRRSGQIRSGNLTAESAAYIRFTIGKKTYETVGHFVGGETVKRVSSGQYVWVNTGNTSKSVVGAGPNYELVTGSIVIAEGVPVIGLSPVFL